MYILLIWFVKYVFNLIAASNTFSGKIYVVIFCIVLIVNNVKYQNQQQQKQKSAKVYKLIILRRRAPCSSGP